MVPEHQPSTINHQPQVPTFVLPAREDTLTFSRALGGLLQPGDVIALIGDLGVGKTTLTQGIAQGMGITDPVTSPTFTLVQEYGRRMPLFHFDPYRLERPEDVYDFGFEEYLERGGVVVVEWADKIADLLPSNRLTLTIADREEENYDDEDRLIQESQDAVRIVHVESSGLRYEWLVAALSEIMAGEQSIEKA